MAIFLRKTHVLIMNYFPTATYLYRIIKNIQDYTMPSKTRVVGGQYSSPIRAIAQRGIIQSKSFPSYGTCHTRSSYDPDYVCEVSKQQHTQCLRKGLARKGLIKTNADTDANAGVTT